MDEMQRVEIEKERKLWCKAIVSAQVYLIFIALMTVNYLFNPFKLDYFFVITMTAVLCVFFTIVLLALCIYFCRPSPKEILHPAPIRKLTAASIETDPAFYIGGTID